MKRNAFWGPQGSILGPLLFNIFLRDLSFTVESIDIASYSDDATLYTPYSCYKKKSINFWKKKETATNEIFKVVWWQCNEGKPW